jgi:Rod binding domain-containing protein
MSTAPIGAVGAPAPAPAAAADPQVREAAQGFEALFLQMIVGEMMESATDGEEAGGAVLGGLATEKLADHLAQTGGFGLAAMLEHQLAPAEETP